MADSAARSWPTQTPGERRAALHTWIEAQEGVLVCFSGGVDSAYLLAEAHRALGAHAVALTAISASLAPGERAHAAAFARDLGVQQIEVHSAEGTDPAYRRNDPDRCFFCKSELYRLARTQAERLGLHTVIDGFNRDDRGDRRPGREAARVLGVCSPLDEVGMRKAEIRAAAREMGLSVWDRPATACLASRIPYGTQVTSLRLSRVGRAEAGLKALGFEVLRVRDHHPVARIEVGVAEIQRLFRSGEVGDPETLESSVLRGQVVDAVRAAGFPFVTLDLEGYRQGALNEILPDGVV